MKQTSFLPKIDLRFGGNLRKGRRKITRPVDPRRAMHVVMSAKAARGAHSMLADRNKREISRTVAAIAKKTGIRVYRFVNVGNHLHFLVQTPNRPALAAFLRELAGRIAMRVTGAAKGRARKFWDGLAFTRIVEWGRDFKGLRLYMAKNAFEAAGLLTRAMKDAGMRARWVGD